MGGWSAVPRQSLPQVEYREVVKQVPRQEKYVDKKDPNHVIEHVEKIVRLHCSAGMELLLME